ncbi:DMT family transporter [Oceanicella actignis]|uniref:Permease of the drug/metabolite transporter (DMT) superfamily n=1 Tax=Oceanicella actignis TaxID=1189325 RepID=A0A1M7TXM3_9RHOB|nr:DMT family transporter [Oceanicella actignis]SET80442.1 Permease of the drug/metabolite transporter (DMT) superfamily [Oceanicella actignis]SHN75451.1 Permease of the drug/metabolite transporter (DMT) superfamily [Oceanicella actignis]
MRITNRAWAELALLSLIWGASFLTIALALRATGPFTAVFWRACLGAGALWAAALAMRLGVPRDLRFWGACAVMGLLNNVVPFTLMAWGQTSIESGLTAILNATTAVFGVLTAAAFLRDERLTAPRAAGVALGLAGVAAIVGPEALGAFDIRSLGQLAVLGGALSYALASVWGRARLGGRPPVVAAAGMTSAATLMMAPLMLLVEGPPRLDLGAAAWGAILYYALIGTALAYLLYYRILAMAGAANLMLVTLMIPPTAIVLGRVVLDERLAPSAYLGFALIALGLIAIDGRAAAALRRARRPAPRAAPPTRGRPDRP